MARPDHYAILVAINYYPGLSDLAGPENDIAAFEKWLVSREGGDLDTANVQTIRSSQFAKVTDANDANPTERALIKALNKLVRVDGRSWKNRVGERLYLYMAGHGFTAGSSISDPAIFSAVAQNGDTAHIAGYRYAAKLANAGFFGEIVLVMDCCQDVLKASQVLEPTWTPPDRNKAKDVKLLQAYGAPRGQAAFERVDEVEGVTRGIFSRVLLEALNTALPDQTGFVTGTTLKNQFLQLWGDRYKQETGYDPPIRPPDTHDIKLFPRTVAALTADGIQPVLFKLAPPIPDGAAIQIMRGSTKDIVLALPGNALGPAKLPPGLYKAMLTGTNRARLFEVTGAEQTEVEL